MRPLVYLAGPITGCSYNGATDWRDTAVAQLAAHGIHGLSPMRGKQYLSHLTDISPTGRDQYDLYPMSTPSAIVARDRFDATRCDVLLVNFLGATRVSIGTVLEIAWADSHRVPIVLLMEADGSNPHEHAMINHLVGFRATSLDEGIEIVSRVLSPHVV